MGISKQIGAVARLRLQERFLINAGGCGVFACMAIEALKYQTNICPLWIEFDAPVPKKATPMHAMLWLPNHKIIFDSNGIMFRGEKPSSVLYHGLPCEVNYGGYGDLKRLVEMTSGWNDTFDRSNIDLIERLVLGALFPNYGTIRNFSYQRSEYIATTKIMKNGSPVVEPVK